MVCELFSSHFPATSPSTLPFSQSIKSSVLVGEVGLVGAVEGGVSGPEAMGMVEPRCHEVASKVSITGIIAQACQIEVRQH